MKVRIPQYVYPAYIVPEDFPVRSPVLHALFVEHGVILEREHWPGTLEGMPSSPGLLRTSTTMRCRREDLGARCIELGHLAYYQDRILLSDGSYDDEVKEAVERFVAAARAREIAARGSVIRHLRSFPSDETPPGKADHECRVAARLLDLAADHLLGKDPEDAQALQEEAYPVVRSGVPGKRGTYGMGADDERLAALRECLSREHALLTDAGLTPLATDPLARRWLLRTCTALAANAAVLQQVADYLHLLHEFAQKPHIASVNGFNGGVGLWAATKQCCQNSFTAVAAVRMLREALLPPLLERLREAGYPDDGETVAWDYRQTDGANPPATGA